MTPRLEARALTFAHKGCPPVLDGVDVTLERGRIYALLGPNGTGKTTLLRLLLGLLRPSAGTILLEGTPLEQLTHAQRARRMAYVPQEAGARFPMTVFEAVLLGRKPHMAWGPGKDDIARTARVLEELHLENLAERTLHELSSGQRQKVALARALVQDTPWLLLDEPISSLDLRHQLEVLTLMRRAAEERRLGVLLSLHDVNMAVRFTHQVMLLAPAKNAAHGANIAATGAAAEVLTPERMQAVYGVAMRTYQAKDDAAPLWFPASC